MNPKEKNLIISPVYNEEKTIERFYNNLREYYAQDILFIDDGSSDKSREFMLNIENSCTFIKRHNVRQGYGASLLSGFRFALRNGYKNIVTIDADLQHEPYHMARIFTLLSEHEVVLGSRYIKISDILNAPRERIVINRYISNLLEQVFSLRFTDPFCGYRGYNVSFLKKALLKDNSYGFSLEILLEIIRTKTAFIEFSVEAIYFNTERKFHDGLEDNRKRLLYYLEIISRKNKEIEHEEKITQAPRK